LTFPHKNILLKSLGAVSEPETSGPWQLHAADRLVLMSGRLAEKIGADSVPALLGGLEAGAAARELLEARVRAGVRFEMAGAVIDIN
jgi:hypothetical protein